MEYMVITETGTRLSDKYLTWDEAVELANANEGSCLYVVTLHAIPSIMWKKIHK